MGKLPPIRVTGALQGDYVVLLEHADGARRIAPEQQDELPRVVRLKQTSSVAPAQWEGELDDGRSLYIRYRHGLLRVGAGEGASEAIKNSAPECALHCERIGDDLDGMMTFRELRGHLLGVLDFPDQLVVELDPDWGSALAL